MRKRALVVAMISMALMGAARYAWAENQQFDRNDLLGYETADYGIDLPEWYEDAPFFLVWTRGDGQAFVTLAKDPLVQGPARELGITLYRFGRVGYSVLGRLIVGWRTDLIPVGLFLINTLGVGILGWIAGSKIDEWGYRSLWLVANPAVFIAYTGDTAEIVGLAAIALGAVTARRSLTLLAAIALGTTRPSYLTAAPLARRGWPLMWASVGAAVALQVFGLMGLGLDWAGAGGNLAPPFTGFVEAWSGQSREARTIALGVALVAILSLFAAVRERGRRRFAFVATALLVLSLEHVVIEAPRNLLRASGALPLLWVIGSRGSAEPPTRDELDDQPL